MAASRASLAALICSVVAHLKGQAFLAPCARRNRPQGRLYTMSPSQPSGGLTVCSVVKCAAMLFTAMVSRLAAVAVNGAQRPRRSRATFCRVGSWPQAFGGPRDRHLASTSCLLEVTHDITSAGGTTPALITLTSTASPSPRAVLPSPPGQRPGLQHQKEGRDVRHSSVPWPAPRHWGWRRSDGPTASSARATG